MERVERTYYPDGALKEEVHYRGAREHGPWRKWHPNGVLAEEYFLEDGLYTNSVSRTWFDTGALKSQVHWVNGAMVGPLTVYNEDGSILVRKYLTESGEVSRTTYDRLCATRPDLPRCTDPPETTRTRKRRRGSTPERRPRALPFVDEQERAFVEELVGGRTAEALGWLRGSPDGAARTLGEMAPEESVALVEELYGLGAAYVLAVKIDGMMGGAETANHVLVQLPRAAKARERLFAFEEEQGAAQGFDPDPDRGQAYMFLTLC